MKKLMKVSALSLMLLLVLVSCKKKMSDADLQVKANTVVVNTTTATVEVKEGVAHLSGTFASQQEKDAAIADLKKIEGIKDVMDMATVTIITPMKDTINVVSAENMQKVKDALKDFPKVKAEQMNGELTISGEATPEQRRKIKMSIDALHVGKVNYNYTK